MNSNTINFNDLAVLREFIPFLRLRLRIMKQRIISHDIIDEGENILIVTPCVVGDCLSFLPAVQTFASQHNTSFDIVVSPDFRSLAERIKRVRRVFVAGSSYNRVTGRQCRPKQDVPPEYDLIIVLRLSRDAFDLIRHIRCKSIISSDGTLFKYIFHVVKNSLFKRPVTQSRELMFEVFGLQDAPKTCELYSLFDFNGDASDISIRFPAIKCQERKVLVHMGSGWKVKLWSDDKWVDLLQKVHAFGKYRFFFVGKGDEEKFTFERIQKRLDFEVHSFINAANLWELFLIMKLSDYFIGVDNGPRNLAHYANLRSVTLLNPAAVKNFMPFDERDIVIEKQNRFPANVVNTKRGARLDDINVDEVFEAFKRLIRL